MATGEDKPNGREVQRRETRQRVYAAAVAEFRRVGMADADVSVIAREAGVARGTFYFHFPAKEHVLAELERDEEARLAAQLEKFLARPHDLPGALNEVVRLMAQMERRVFFMLGLYAVLITSHGHSRAARAEILDNFVATVLRSVEAR